MDNQKATLWTRPFISIVIVNFLMYTAFQMMQPTIPVYAEALGSDVSKLGWIAGVSTIASLIMRPLSGMLLDRFGRKIVYLSGLAVAIIMTLAYGFTASLTSILIIRFLSGFGWGTASTSSNTIATDCIPVSRLGEGMGFFGMTGSLALAIAPGIGLYLLSLTDFKIVTYISAALFISSLALSFFLTYKKKTSPINNGGKFKWADLYENSAIMPSVVMFFIGSSYGSIAGFIALYAISRGFHSAGPFYTVYAASLLLSRPISGKIIDKFGFDFTIYPGICLLIIAMILISKAVTMPLLLLSALVYGIGFGAIQPTLQTMSVINAPKNRLGAANGTFFSGFEGGLGFGSVVAGIIASRVGYEKMYFSFIFFILIALILYFLFTRVWQKK